MVRNQYLWGCIILLLFAGQAFSQEKLEKESRLKPADVPQKALDFTGSIKTPVKWKWYLEESLTEKTVEAKGLIGGKKHSIEFDTSGQLLDIEVEKTGEQIPEQILSRITNHLKSAYVKHTIQKIQIQYAGKPEQMAAIAGGSDPGPSVTIQWELVVKGKNQGRPKLYEITFDQQGNHSKTKEIIFKNTDNLEY